MSFLYQFLLAVGLAMDAFSVSIYKGVKESKFNFWLCLTLGITFGFMQGFMPLLGYFLTSIPFLKTFIQDYSKYIIFVLLLIIGGKMLYESIKESIELKNNNKSNDKEVKTNTCNEKDIKENTSITNKDNNIISQKPKRGLCFSKEIFFLGIATSIDALSIGITFTGEKMLLGATLLACLIIAIVSLVFSFVGCMFGKVLSKFIKNYAGIFGGVVLILIGIKVLLGL